ncbi:MAG: TetR family transcriptional regulator [Ruminococcus sp.]
MIKKTFYNLPQAKQDRILASIKKEFDRAPLDKISINSIIKDAGISRGSFYQYFDDKGDLYDIFADKFSEEIKQLCSGTLATHKGDIFKTMGDIMDRIVHNINDFQKVNMIKKFMPGESVNAKVVIDRICNNCKDYFSTLIRNIDTSRLTVKTPKEIESLLSLLGGIVKEAMLDYFLINHNLDKVTEDFNYKINIIKNGCLKEEYKTQQSDILS